MVAIIKTTKPGVSKPNIAPTFVSSTKLDVALTIFFSVIHFQGPHYILVMLNPIWNVGLQDG